MIILRLLLLLCYNDCYYCTYFFFTGIILFIVFRWTWISELNPSSLGSNDSCVWKNEPMLGVNEITEAVLIPSTNLGLSLIVDSEPLLL